MYIYVYVVFVYSHIYIYTHVYKGLRPHNKQKGLAMFTHEEKIWLGLTIAGTTGRLKWMAHTCYRMRGKGLGLLPVTASSLLLTPCHYEEAVFAVAMLCCVPGNELCNFTPATLWHAMLWAFPWFLNMSRKHIAASGMPKFIWNCWHSDGSVCNPHLFETIVLKKTRGPYAC